MMIYWKVLGEEVGMGLLAGVGSRNGLGRKEKRKEESKSQHGRRDGSMAEGRQERVIYVNGGLEWLRYFRLISTITQILPFPTSKK